MEVMEEGNLMDRVPILLQRDLAYYQQHQSVLQENLCVAVVGGVLDFPHYASFAAVKMILWWEEEHIAAFRTVSGLLQGEEVASMSADRGCGGVAKTSAPSTMVKMVTQSAAQLLEHLHTLSQEALDHADLQVLTGTLGAAALVKNCIWTYNQNLIKADIGLSLVNSYKLFQEMAESLAERLLDLHCRLISLYVLQDADCLNWEHNQPFFEGERGSFVIQMWWLYMQGTRSNLWTTVPPKTAQRVLAGMLNESLTILNVRYTQARASSARAMLIATDISNLLQCVRQILPAICTSAAELTGCNVHSQLVMDVHAKCHALLTCLLLRASPLAILHKVFHKGVSNVQCLSPTPTPSIVPWMTVISPENLKLGTQNMKQLIPTQAVSLELAVLLAQPQPSWHLLLKVLMMQHCWVASRLMLRLAEHPYSIGNNEQEKKCKGFLCSGDCFLPPTSVEQALVHILITVGSTEDLACTLLPRLDMTNQTWAESLNRSQVWNQMKPPWLQAMVDPLTPCLEPVVKILKKAAKEGAKKKEVIVLCVELLCQICDCLPPGLGACCTLLTDALPANSNPLAGSVLIQVLMSALYTQLIDTPIAETLCSLQDNQLTPLVNCVSELGCLGNPIVDLESSPHVCEVQVSQLLLMPTGWKALKVMYTYLKTNSGWLIEALGRTPPPPNAHTLLYTMFHVGGNPFDQLLSGTWSPDWMSLFKSPLGLTPKAIWQQLSLRPEFWEDRQLTEHDHAVVCKLRNLFTSFQ